MGATLKPVPVTENYRPMLQAMLDNFQHPVWITDDSGMVLKNQPAKDLERQGFNLFQTTSNLPFNECAMLRFKNKDISAKKSSLNFGTNSNVVIHEVTVETAVTARLKESTIRLRTALAR